jgi:hypothetical protein
MSCNGIDVVAGPGREDAALLLVGDLTYDVSLLAGEHVPTFALPAPAYDHVERR